MENEEFRKRTVDALEIIAKPPAAEADLVSGPVERIRTLAQGARSSWFWFFGILAFSLLTLLNLSDADFFSLENSATLPILNYDIALRPFVLLVPIILAAVFLYLHAYIEQIWSNVGSLPPESDGEPISFKLYPWMLVEFALYVRWFIRTDERNTPCLNFTTLGLLGVTAIALIVWLGTPVIVMGYWWKSLVAHETWFSLTIGFCVWLTLFTSYRSIRSLHGAIQLSMPPAVAKDGDRDATA